MGFRCGSGAVLNRDPSKDVFRSEVPHREDFRRWFRTVGTGDDDVAHKCTKGTTKGRFRKRSGSLRMKGRDSGTEFLRGETKWSGGKSDIAKTC